MDARAGSHSIEIQVLKDNEASWKLYEPHGFPARVPRWSSAVDEYIDDAGIRGEGKGVRHAPGHFEQVIASLKELESALAMACCAFRAAVPRSQPGAWACTIKPCAPSWMRLRYKRRTGDSQSMISNLRLIHGTLAVPAFNFAFARGKPMTPWRPPRRHGAYSEYVRP